MASAEEVAEIVGDLEVADTFDTEMNRMDREIWNEFVTAMKEQQEILNNSYHASALTLSEKRTLQGMFNALDPNRDGRSIEDGFGSAEIVFNGLIVVRADGHGRHSVELKSSPAVKHIDRIPSARCKIDTPTIYPHVGDKMSFLGLDVKNIGCEEAGDLREYLESGAKIFVPTDNLVKR